MIKMNLTRRIWLAFVSLIVLVTLSIMIVYPLSIRGTMTEETYRMIENHIQMRLNDEVDYSSRLAPWEHGFHQASEGKGMISYFLMRLPEGKARIDDTQDPIITKMMENAANQKKERQRYEMTFDGQTLFYVMQELKHEVYIVSFMWDTYRDEMVDRLWERLLYLVLLTSVLSLLPAIWLKHYLKQPLALLGHRLEQIANRNWQEALHWEGDPDFERLSFQFEKMRKNLNRYDRSQKTFIQHASHELKTPIMVIKSYAASVKDGMMPKDSLEQTMDVITEEANRMERRVIDMLYYTKLDQMQQEQLQVQTFLFGQLAYQIEERFRYQRDDVTIHVGGADVVLQADLEQCEVLLENLVENGLRYATGHLSIRAIDRSKTVDLIVENQGEPIDDDLTKLFQPFYKGNKGKFGLGLAIVKQIATLHHGTAQVENTEDGVRFTISIPKQSSTQQVPAEKKKKKERRRGKGNVEKK
ncbi:sensor histidine kinase [Shouchella lonarensis]|uniref:histidine kinase n=1 Tax=Shouchella lonarensis TaxID=1464122 RepID=A0A1G6JV67_9BACI|nr:HAMP domain-containing sensor histidine kinase [Shouchella lonarensis]SDC22640.1 two-component system, OmpR family, sensor histidine kinase CssS [Shouchella lonarensis]